MALGTFACEKREFFDRVPATNERLWVRKQQNTQVQCGIAQNTMVKRKRRGSGDEGCCCFDGKVGGGSREM
jgi:hypothetical protein